MRKKLPWTPHPIRFKHSEAASGEYLDRINGSRDTKDGSAERSSPWEKKSTTSKLLRFLIKCPDTAAPLGNGTARNQQVLHAQDRIPVAIL